MQESTLSDDLLKDNFLETTPLLKDCWNQIGVMGDRSCGELNTVIHCYECPIFAAVGDSLLEREPPIGYVEEWREILAETAADSIEPDSDETAIRNHQTISIVIFGLGNQRLAFPVSVLQEVTSLCTIQPIPHRTNDLFLGLVNIRGETLLCASLQTLFNLQPSEDPAAKKLIAQTSRMIVAGQGEHKWVFPVDRVFGDYRFHQTELQPVPVVVAKAAEAYTQGVINAQGEQVNYLDSELLFYTLERKIL
jgi:chemotaxis-related protein WspD